MHTLSLPRLKQFVGRTNPSERELQILQLIVRGRSNKEAAGDLGISTETVKTHLRSLFRKLGVMDRTQAVVEGFRRGIAHLDELS